MNIMHIKNLANVSALYARGQRKLGHNARFMDYHKSEFYGDDIVITPNMNHSHLRRLLSCVPPIYKQCVKGFDVIHFHHEPSFVGHSFLKYGGIDYPLLKMLRKKIILQYHGVNPTRYTNKLTKKYTDLTIVSTPNLLQNVPDAIWIKDPVDTSKFPFKFKENGEGKIRIVTACISREHEKVKGTRYMRLAVSNLQKEGYDIELQVIQHVPHILAVEMYKKADIIIDQLVLGIYSIFSVECMLLGKPVCCYIDQDFKDCGTYVDKHLIHEVTNDNLEDKLVELIEDVELRRKLAYNGRNYAVDNHSLDVCTNMLMNTMEDFL